MPFYNSYHHSLSVDDGVDMILVSVVLIREWNEDSRHLAVGIVDYSNKRRRMEWLH